MNPCCPVCGHPTPAEAYWFRGDRLCLCCFQWLHNVCRRLGRVLP